MKLPVRITPRVRQYLQTVTAVVVIAGVAWAGVRLLNPSQAATNPIVYYASTQVGQKEEPLGSNRGPMVNVYTDGNAEPWCADFVSWIYRKAGVAFTGGASGGWRIASVASAAQWFKSKGTWHYRSSSYIPKPGDFVRFNWSGCECSSNNHAGIVERVDGTTLYTIEGNSSDMVRRKVYYNYKTYNKIIGFGHRASFASTAPAPISSTTPDNPYSCSTRPTLREGSTGTCVKSVQWALNNLKVSPYSYGLTIDGQFGPLTESAVKKFEASRGITIDGIVGPQTWEKLDQYSDID